MSSFSLPVSTLGVPRIGPWRELKAALESYWSGKTDQADLLEAAAALRGANWARQKALGVTVIPSNDFSLYDHVLDTCVMVGAIPATYGWSGGELPLDTYFAMARGRQGESGAIAMPALEMTKWFDTNYHYMVPEFSADQRFSLGSTKPIDEYEEAKALGYETRPVFLGPITFLTLGKTVGAAFDRLELLDRLLPVYVEMLRRLAKAGARRVQIDEPCLVLDLDAAAAEALRRAYAVFAAEVPEVELVLATYFGGLADNLDLALGLPVAGLHVDLVRAPEQLDPVLAKARPEFVLSLGVIDGRNIWRSNLAAILDRLEPVVAGRAEGTIEIASSCSMLHVPIDLESETELDADLRSWLAFSVQKMGELATLAKALVAGRDSVRQDIDASATAAAGRRASAKVHNEQVRVRVKDVTPAMTRRKSEFGERIRLQREKLHLPVYPTTTIGSFPQTETIRKARLRYMRGDLDQTQYEALIRSETEQAIRWQEEVGLNVLVHGEFERNDMVQYFGERLVGFAFTRHAWVQSYGSRYVRPPILFGDVSRREPMTVDWWRYAQSLTNRPVKGMLTGPVTILNWSFVRDDLPRSTVCRQIALAIRDEVLDLESAGAVIVQIDEAALREGLPLRRSRWTDYLGWAVESFQLTAAGVRDETQIHTHMCYSEFNDIIEAIAAMDADVISIETSRSRMELLEAFRQYRYPNEIGPGVYDIHSPRIPDIAEMVRLLNFARERLKDEQIWVNPDCGLKTRRWEEVRPALVNMVEAARQLRAAATQAAE